MNDIEVSNKIIKRLKSLLSESKIVNATIDLGIGSYPTLKIEFVLDDKLIKAMQKDEES